MCAQPAHTLSSVFQALMHSLLAEDCFYATTEVSGRQQRIELLDGMYWSSDGDPIDWHRVPRIDAAVGVIPCNQREALEVLQTVRC